MKQAQETPNLRAATRIPKPVLNTAGRDSRSSQSNHTYLNGADQRATESKRTSGAPAGLSKTDAKQEKQLSPSSKSDASVATAPSGRAGAFEQKPKADPNGTPSKKPPLGSLTLTGDPAKDLKSFMSLSPSEQARAYKSLGTGMTQSIAKSGKDGAAAVPRVKTSLPGAAKDSMEPGKDVAPKTHTLSDPKVSPEPEKLKVTPHQHEGEAPSNEEASKSAAKSGGFFDWLADTFTSFVGSLVTVDRGLVTKIPERYESKLEGDADPGRSDAAKAEADTATAEASAETRDAIESRKPGDTIRPAGANAEGGPIEAPEAPSLLVTKPDPALDDYAAADLPENVRALADRKLGKKMADGAAEAQAKIDAANKEHLNEAQKNAEQATMEASNLQSESTKAKDDALAAGKLEIQGAQKEGLAESKKIGDAHKIEVDKEHVAANKDVTEQAAKDNKKADETLEQGEKDAEAKRIEGEKQAEEEKKKADEKSKDKGFWDRVGDAIGDVVSSVTKAIKFAFDAARKAVSAVIDAAKNLVVGLIEAGRKWMVNRINDFRNTLKKLVNNTIGKAFPALAKFINKKIDDAANKAIAGVNAVADKMKKGVEAIANAIKKGFDWLSKKFETALVAVVGITGALLKGDLKEALKIAFYAACEILGVDPSKIEEFMMKAAAKIGKIWKDIPAFASNAAKGVINGFNQFGKNFGQHLIDGAISWFTGAFTAIVIPKTFDLKGIFSLVGQILGISYESIKQRVIKKLPAAGPIINKIEEYADDIKKLVVGFMKDGPIAIWEWVKDKLADFKDKVMEEIISLLTGQVVEAGIKWIAGLAAFPIGAIIKGAMALWDLVKFIRDKYNQIKEFFSKVYDLVSDIADGNVQMVADALEGVLARLIPVGLGLLASLIGIGDVSEKVTAMLGKFHAKIEEVTEPVIDLMVAAGKKILAFGDKVVGKVKDVAGKIYDQALMFLGITSNFEGDDKEKHTLSFKQRGDDATLMVASEEKVTFREFLNQHKDWAMNGTAIEKENYAKAVRLSGEIDVLKSTKVTGKDEDEKKENRKVREKKMQKLTDELAMASRHLFGYRVPESTKEDTVTYSADGATLGKKMTRKILTFKHDPGSPPTSAKHEIFDALKMRGLSNSTSYFYVKGHLLNEKLGGKGTYDNLTPLTYKANPEHERLVESKVKEAVESGSVVSYTVQAIYTQEENPLLKTASGKLKQILLAEKHVPKKLVCNANTLHLVNHVWTVKKPIVDHAHITNTLEGPYFDRTGKALEPDSRKKSGIPI